MFDAQIRPLIDRLLNPVGRGLVALGVTANQVIDKLLATVPSA